MQQPHFLLKLGAVVSALLLAGGFVSYQAGAFNWLTKPSATQPADSIPGGSKSKVLIAPTSSDTTDNQPPATTQQAPSDTTSATPTIIGGSKSLFPAGQFNQTKPADQTPTTPQQPPPDPAPKPIIIPSSKAGPIFTPPPAPETPPPQPPAPSQPSKP
jgi:hypothetical protein